MAKVLIIGSGGREQALAWKIAQSNQVNQIFVAPGNGGSKGKVQNIDIGFTDVPALLDFAKNNSIDLTVVGQEAASEAGVVDEFKQAGLLIFGPTKNATRIESSKAFSKDLMAKENIPTAEYKNFTDATEAVKYASTRPLPVVIKADGLATGKGVIICSSVDEIESAVEEIMIKRSFGSAGDKVVVEDFLKGQEVSTHALCDGNTALMFPASQDHKQVYDGDKGPNTGGMGVIAPVPWVSKDQIDYVKDKIVEPALDGLREQNSEFSGCLYPGLMIDGSEINTLEFNARFGDPETEVYMRLLDSDLYEIFVDCAKGQLKAENVKWADGYAVTVVLASEGYPASYPKDLPISGIEKAEEIDGVVVFHAGTAIKDGQLVTAGGRVLNVTATANTLDEALDKAYAAIKQIHFEGMHYRTDIGRRQKA